MIRYAILALAVIAAFAVANVQADSSGPNSSGYLWFNSASPGPQIPFAWVDATGGTLNPDSDCDDCAETVAIGFTFNYFGTNYTMIDISTNGILSFDTGSACNDNYNWSDDDLGHTIPHDDAACEGGTDGWGGNPLIAPWFDDLDPGECGSIYYDTMGSAPNRTFVVQYQDVCHNDCSACAAGEGVTFEVILAEGSNDILFQYMDSFFSAATADIAEENYGGTSTIGLDKDAMTGLQYLNAFAGIPNNFAVLFQQPTDVGDVNCDGVSSVDALLLLQFTAALINSFTCPANAYVNADSAANAVDALLVLQYVAGLLPGLPPA
jgi:hypothetical protein